MDEQLVADRYTKGYSDNEAYFGMGNFDISGMDLFLWGINYHMIGYN